MRVDSSPGCGGALLRERILMQRASASRWLAVRCSTAWVSCIADRRRQLSCVGEGVYSDATQLDVELSCVAINGPLGVTSSLAVIHTIHGRRWLARDRCTRPRLVGLALYTVIRITVTAYSAWRLVLQYPQTTKTRPPSAIYWPRCNSYRSQSQIFV